MGEECDTKGVREGTGSAVTVTLVRSECGTWEGVEGTCYTKRARLGCEVHPERMN